MCETLEKIVIDDLRKLIYRTCREKSGVAVVWIEREGYSLLGGTTRSPLQMGDPRVWWRVPPRRAKEEGEREIKEERVKIRG